MNTPAKGHSNRSSTKPEEDILADTGALLRTIETTSLDGTTDDSTTVSLTDYEFLSSYNWVNKGAPVIYVPGAPAAWKDKSPPFVVPKDQGTYFIDQNAARCAKYPAEALFRSLAVMQPEFSMRDVDVVTDRNCLRKLLRFVSNDVDSSFRIDVKMNGDVLFLCRWEAELKRVILGSEFFGYGHNFEKAMTVFDRDLKDSSGHHRVARYSLGGIRCLIRFEVDGYSGAMQPAKGRMAATADDDADDLLGALTSLSITSPQGASNGSVEVLRKGREAETSSIIEIKTRAAHKRLQFDDIIPQLWFAQTPKLMIGYHASGIFEEVNEVPMKEKFVRWEKQNQVQLKKLVSLLTKLRDIV